MIESRLVKKRDFSITIDANSCTDRTARASPFLCCVCRIHTIYFSLLLYLFLLQLGQHFFLNTVIISTVVANVRPHARTRGG